MSADLPLPDGPEMMVKLPRSIFKSIPDSMGIDVGQENEAFFTVSKTLLRIRRVREATMSQAISHAVQRLLILNLLAVIHGPYP